MNDYEKGRSDAECDSNKELDDLRVKTRKLKVKVRARTKEEQELIRLRMRMEIIRTVAPIVALILQVVILIRIF
jgi:hypothetical protein